MRAVLECDRLSKSYQSGKSAETVLHDVELTLREGESAVLLGPSGSGKTTLLSILGGLLEPSAGQVRVNGSDVYRDRRGDRTSFRRREIGFVFQHAQLLPFLTVEENVRVVGANSGVGEPELSTRSADLLGRLGLCDHVRKTPDQLSGGQRQRVAISRALVHRPSVVLADEPTAALDWKTGEAAVSMLLEQAATAQAAVLVVTHDTRLVPLFDRVFHIDSGRLCEQ